MKKTVILFIPAFIIPILYTSALPSNCKEAVDLYNKGTISKNLIKKEQLFKEALSLNCQDKGILASVHNNLADTYEKAGRVDLAIKEYKKALSLNPRLATSYFSLGDIFFKQGVFEYAVENYEKGLALENDEIAKINIEAARKKIPLYKSKQEIVASLSVKRSIKQVPSVNLYFGFDKSILTEKSERQLNTLLNALRDDELESFRFRLAGHTCSIGTDEYNQQLSERRSDAVRNWLKEHDFPSHHLEITGFGEKNPIEDNTTEEGRMLNRRVEIRTVGIAVSGKRNIGDHEGMKLFREGQKFYDQNNYQSAAARFEEAFRLFKERGNKEGIRAAAGTLAILYRELGNNIKVTRYLKEYQEIEKDM